MNECSLNFYKQKTVEMCIRKGWYDVDIPILWMLLIEEVGELASAIRRTTNKFNDRKKIYIEGELIDVMSYLFQIADRFNVDLDKTWRERASRIKETEKIDIIYNDKCTSV